MSDAGDYTPPKVWTFDKQNGGVWASINRPTSGATHEKPLPRGRHPCSSTRWGHRTASRSRSSSKNCWRRMF